MIQPSKTYGITCGTLGGLYYSVESSKYQMGYFGYMMNSVDVSMLGFSAKINSYLYTKGSGTITMTKKSTATSSSEDVYTLINPKGGNVTVTAPDGNNLIVKYRLVQK